MSDLLNNYGRSASDPPNTTGIWRGRVTSVGASTFDFVIPRLTGVYASYTAQTSMVPVQDLTVDDDILVSFTEGRNDEIAVLGRVKLSTSITGGTVVATGDITSVTAGTNLTGGGVEGDLTINLDNNIILNSVTATLIGNATTASALNTGRNIGGVYFDGSADIDLPGVNTTGNQSTSGSAATLSTARTIQLTGDVTGSTTFDGSANASISTSLATSYLPISGGTLTGDLSLRSGNNVHDSIYRVGGIFFTWDSDSYGTNSNHSIRSTDGDTWGDHITINSYGNVRVNIDSNGNGSNTFTIGRHTTGTANTLLTLNESGQLTTTGSITATGGSVVGGTFIGANGTDIYGTGGRNYFKDSEKSSGAGLRVGAAWNKYGIYSEDGDLVVGATTGTIRFGDNQGSYVSNSRIFWQTSYGNLSAGPLNTSWCHFETDRPNFYFNKGITVDTGYISSYDEDLELHRAGTKRLDITSSENYFTGTRTVHSNSTNGSAYTNSQLQSYSGYGSGGVASWTGHIGGQLAPVFRVWTGTGEGFDCNNYIGSNYAYVGGSQFITRSSERFKKNIKSQPDEELIPNIMELLNCRTIKFDDKHVDPYWCEIDECFKEVELCGDDCDCDHCCTFRADPIQRRHFGRRGYLVEELAEVYPTAVHFESDGKPSGIDYSAITVELIDAVKLLVLQGDEITRRLDALEATA